MCSGFFSTSTVPWLLSKNKRKNSCEMSQAGSRGRHVHHDRGPNFDPVTHPLDKKGLHPNNGLFPQLVVREMQPEDQAEAQEELPSSGHQNCSWGLHGAPEKKLHSWFTLNIFLKNEWTITAALMPSASAKSTKHLHTLNCIYCI